MARKINKRNNIKVVIQNDFIKARASQNMEANAQKLLRIAIAQCAKDDTEFYKYQVSGIELAEMFGVSKQDVYQHIDKWTSQCMGTVMEFKRPDEKEFHKFPLFDGCSYKSGVLTFELHNKMTPFVLEIKERLGFTQYELASILTVKGKYTIRLYEMMMMEIKNKKVCGGDAVEFDLSIEEIRIQTSTEKRYKKIIDLKKNVILNSVEEIEKSMNWKIETTDIKSGRAVKAIHFKVWSKWSFNWGKMIADEERAAN